MGAPQWLEKHHETPKFYLSAVVQPPNHPRAPQLPAMFRAKSASSARFLASKYSDLAQRDGSTTGVKTWRTWYEHVGKSESWTCDSAFSGCLHINQCFFLLKPNANAVNKSIFLNSGHGKKDHLGVLQCITTLMQIPNTFSSVEVFQFSWDPTCRTAALLRDLKRCVPTNVLSMFMTWCLIKPKRGKHVKPAATQIASHRKKSPSLENQTHMGI